MGMRRAHILSYDSEYDFNLLQEGLQHRDFIVRRLNTYNTVPVESLAPADVAAAQEASVAAFASPSAIKSWLALVGGQDTADVAIACIGNLQLIFATELSLRPKPAQAQAWMSIASEALLSLPQGA